MNVLDFHLQRFTEDRHRLADYERLWLRYSMGSMVEEDPFERMYCRRLAETVDELIINLQAKMVRKWL